MNRLKKTLAVIICSVLLMSTFSVTAFAAETDNNPAFAGQTTVQLKQGAALEYADGYGWTTHMLYADSNMTYCLKPDKAVPPTGKYSTDSGNLKEVSTSSTNYQLLRKALYYCYGGAGFNTSNTAFATDTSKHQQHFEGNTMAAFMGNLKYSQYGFNMLTPTGSSLHYLLTHRVLSYIYGYSSWNANLPSKDWEDAIKEIAIALRKAPSVPVLTKLYVMDIGSNYQQVILQKNVIKLQMQKQSANPTLTNDNSCYSLNGGKYNIYLDKNCTEYFGYITTDENGFGKYGSGTNGIDVSLQTYYAREVVAPKGYALDNTVYQFKNSGKTDDGIPIYSFSCKDTPLNDPVVILLKKQDAITGEATTKLAGAEFTIKYYDGMYSTKEEIETVSASATRTWVVKTDEKGVANLDASHLVSGDDFYYVNGVITLPLGTVTIQETKAPDGYLINEELYISQITSDGGVGVKPLNAPVVPETSANGFIGVHKTDVDGVAVANAVYGLYSKNEADSNGMLLEANRISTITTDVNGKGTFDVNVPVGTTYYVQEITAPAGYSLDKKAYDISAGSENVTIENPAIVEIVEDILTGDLKITKKADDNIISNIYFDVTSSSGKQYIVATNSKGIATLNNLPVFDKSGNKLTYTVKELGVRNANGTYTFPARYIPTTPVTMSLTENTVTTFNFDNKVRVGSLRITKTADDGIIDNLWFNITGSNGKNYGDFATNDLGQIELNNLPVFDYSGNKISYTVKELGVKDTNGNYYFPLKYIPVGTQTKTLLENNTTYFVFHNTVDSRKIKITKESYDGQNEDVWFNISDSTGKNYGDFVTKDNGSGEGIAKINNLPIYDINDNVITYTVKELGFKNSSGQYYFPDRYVPNTKPQTVTLDKCDSTFIMTVDFYNDYKYGNLKLIKTSEDGVVADVYFDITDTYGGSYGKFKTDENGELSVEQLPVYNEDDELVEYVIKEIGVKNADGTYTFPFRYNTPKTQTIVLSENSVNTVTFNNVLKRGTVTINKTDENQQPMSGAVFALYNSDGTKPLLSQTGSSSYQYNTKGKELDLTTVNGKVTVTNLPQGDYFLIETQSASGHFPYGKKIEFSITANSNETLNPIISVQNEKIIVPDTGGIGTTEWIGYIIISICLLGFGTVFLKYYKTNKKTQ